MKSLILPLHKFTIRNLDLFFSFSGKKRCVLTDLSIYGEDGKKIVPSESRIAFCRFFIVRVKKVRYEEKVREELLGCFLHCTQECLRQYVPTTSFRLRNKIECQYYNERNKVGLLIQKTQEKIT